MKRFILSIQFLTVFPIGKPGCPEPGELGRSMAFFPVVGALLGVILIVADAILYKFFPVGVGSVLLLGILLFVSGGLHLDGFADTVDGVAGGITAEERLAIMWDSRVGAMGVAGVVLLLLLKYLCLESLGEGVRWEALLLMPVAGRWAMAPMAAWAGYAREEDGLGKAFVAGIDNSTLITATAITAILFVLLLGILGVIILAVLLLLTYAVTVYFKKKLGGVTGDVFGFLSEVSEGVFLLVVIGFS